METAERQEEVSGRAEEQPARCPNCGAAVRGPFCHGCGQRHRSRIVTLSAFFRDAFSEYFSFDHRLWQTLGLLIRKPGLLTNEYLAGRRARYTKPFRLYLIISAAYFLLRAVVTEETQTFFGGVLAVDASNAAMLGTWLPRLMFVLVPSFALLLKLFYVRARRLYAEHLVFALHYFGFYFLVNVAVLLLDASASRALAERPAWLQTGFSVLLLALLLVPPAYLFFALRRVYGQARGLVLLKTVGLQVGYFLLLALAVGVLIEAGLFRN